MCLLHLVKSYKIEMKIRNRHKKTFIVVRAISEKDVIGCDNKI